MHPSELWMLLAAAVFIGGCGGSLIGYARADRRCCECCTCDDCEPRIEGNVVPLEPRPVQMSSFWDDSVSNLELLDGYSEHVLDGSQIDAERPDTSTWLRTWRLEVEAAYPIPGTPQWEARYMAGVR